MLAGWAFFAGIVLFSGSLYALALAGVRVLGAITPLGGLSFLLGWACLLSPPCACPRLAESIQSVSQRPQP